MIFGAWKIHCAGDEYAVARVISDADGPSHVETYGYAETHEEAEALLREAQGSGESSDWGDGSREVLPSIVSWRKVMFDE